MVLGLGTLYKYIVGKSITETIWGPSSTTGTTPPSSPSSGGVGASPSSISSLSLSKEVQFYKRVWGYTKEQWAWFQTTRLYNNWIMPPLRWVGGHLYNFYVFAKPYMWPAPKTTDSKVSPPTTPLKPKNMDPTGTPKKQTSTAPAATWSFFKPWTWF